jgi:uncharacterized membrane protein YbhN (UPF0104 family)
MGDMVKYSLLLVVTIATYLLLRWKFNELGLTWSDIQKSLSQVSNLSIVIAICITAANFVLLTGYDLIAVRYLRKDLPIQRVMTGAVIGYALSNVLGWLVGGNAIRYRLYSKWGFNLVEIVAFISILSITFWLGLFLLAGVAFVALPVQIPEQYASTLPVQPHVLGWIFLGMIGLYLLASAFIRKPIRWKDSVFTLPPFRLSLMQLVVSAGDFALASLVLYVLLPQSVRGAEAIHFSTIMVAYLAAMIVAVNVHIPGGLGVLEATILFLVPKEAAAEVTAALILFRIIYYFLPAIIALGLYFYVELSTDKPIPASNLKP